VKLHASFQASVLEGNVNATTVPRFQGIDRRKVIPAKLRETASSTNEGGCYVQHEASVVRCPLRCLGRSILAAASARIMHYAYGLRPRRHTATLHNLL
jgi:hypothetical protein